MTKRKGGIMDETKPLSGMMIPKPEPLEFEAEVRAIGAEAAVIAARHGVTGQLYRPEAGRLDVCFTHERKHVCRQFDLASLSKEMFVATEIRHELNAAAALVMGVIKL